MEYADFISGKTRTAQPKGIETPPDLSGFLFDFQKKIVNWSLRRGQSAIFADCGMGKTAMQLEWARVVSDYTGGDVLVLAPLAVSAQTAREGDKFGIDVNVARSPDQLTSGVNITNYERMEKFDPELFAGVVLDESSILKAYTGKFRNEIISRYESTPFKLACTATPSPNDHMELGNHSEFLGCMTRTEMLATFFINDMTETQKWRLKGHAVDEFWRWVRSWAMMIRQPSDIGFSDDGYNLPELNIHEHVCEADNAPDGKLFAGGSMTLTERREARKKSLDERVSVVSKLVDNGEPWIVWCDYNDESDKLAESIPDAVTISGSDKPDIKESRMLGFTDGDIRVLVTKPKIAGFGMNWQHCANVAFVGISDSYEQYYQAIRRCWRFGQDKTVNVHLVLSENELPVIENLKRKENDSMEMSEKMISTDSDLDRNDDCVHSVPVSGRESGDGWDLVNGDCVEVLRGVDPDSIDYSIFSPPFSSLYTYSDSPNDMGNCYDDGEFYNHFGFLISELYRVMKPGRNLSFHCMNLPTSKARDGVIGIKDFRGELIRMFSDAGFVFHSEVCIWKDPVTAMQRTKALGLLYKQLKKDSTMSRQGIPDYLVTMRKPGDNPNPVEHTPSDLPVSEWQRLASPVWMDINQSDTLQYRSARDNADEKHICPLQLDVIRRGIKLWSNPGDLVLTPFAGIGSEMYVSLEMGRRAFGIELKNSYFRQARLNCMSAVESNVSQGSLFG